MENRFWLWTSNSRLSLIWDDDNIIIIIVIAIIIVIIIIIQVYSRAVSATVGRITDTAQTCLGRKVNFRTVAYT